MNQIFLLFNFILFLPIVELFVVYVTSFISLVRFYSNQIFSSNILIILINLIGNVENDCVFIKDQILLSFSSFLFLYNFIIVNKNRFSH